jgi:two-component system, chemotaxis family, protein-glutamate methylesterase/glutaminase
MSGPTHAVVVAASAGGLAPLELLVGPLPTDLTASVFIVHHTSPTGPGYLAAILNRKSSLPCAYATDDEPMRGGRIYIAPPDRHLEIAGDRLTTTSAPKENNVRPAADVLFRSAAARFGARTIGVVVSGMLDDGAEGLAAIVAAGGRAIVQEPDDAMYRGMPESALARVDVDACVPAAALASTVLEMVGEPTPQIRPRAVEPMRRADPTEQPFTCPECNGPLAMAEIRNGLRQFRCLVGHRYSEGSFGRALCDARERTLWSAHRLLRQHAILHGIRAERARRLGDVSGAAHFETLARRAREDAGSIEEMLGPGDQFEALVLPERAAADDWNEE